MGSKTNMSSTEVTMTKDNTNKPKTKSSKPKSIKSSKVKLKEDQEKANVIPMDLATVKSEDVFGPRVKKISQFMADRNTNRRCAAYAEEYFKAVAEKFPECWVDYGGEEYSMFYDETAEINSCAVQVIHNEATKREEHFIYACHEFKVEIYPELKDGHNYNKPLSERKKELTTFHVQNPKYPSVVKIGELNLESMVYTIYPEIGSEHLNLNEILEEFIPNVISNNKGVKLHTTLLSDVQKGLFVLFGEKL